VPVCNREILRFCVAAKFFPLSCAFLAFAKFASKRETRVVAPYSNPLIAGHDYLRASYNR